MRDKQNEMWDTLCELDGETVARLFTDYHGTQLLDDGFRAHLQEEGYLEPDEDGPECCEDCDACPLDIWRACPNKGDYLGDDDEK